MNNLLKSCSFLVLIALFSTACGAPATQPESTKENEATADFYEVVLGKSVSTIQVANFLTSNNCRDARPFQICEEIGIALWVNPRQVIETVYLYVNNSAGFEPYKGKFPFGLKFYDTLGAAEYKLKRQGVGHAGRIQERLLIILVTGQPTTRLA